MAEKLKGSTKRFGARYGRTVKYKLSKVESLSKKQYKCPYCASVKVKKQSVGIWECSKCEKVFTSKAYHVAKQTR